MDNNKRKIHTANSDNELLEPFTNGAWGIGQVDEVNGAGAEEMPFMPTRHELRVLARYYAEEVLASDYFWFLYAQTGSTEIRVKEFGLRRLTRIAALIGQDAVDAAWDEVEKTFRKGCDPRHWEIFKRGTPAEWEAVREEVDNAVRRRLGEPSAG